MRTILVVEDEPQIAALVRDYLEHAGFAVLPAADGAAALATFRARRPDALVLDLGLPRVDGLDVVRAIRRDSTVPIVILTARGDEIDRVTGLELGADDYVVKPFSPKELVARVRAVLRRVETPPPSDERIAAGDLELDLARRRVTAAGRVVQLTPTEFELLATLAREPGRVWTRSQLLDRGARLLARDVRAGDRRPHPEPAPQARARRRGRHAALRAHRPRRRLRPRRARGLTPMADEPPRPPDGPTARPTRGATRAPSGTGRAGGADPAGEIGAGTGPRAASNGERGAAAGPAARGSSAASSSRSSCSSRRSRPSRRGSLPRCWASSRRAPRRRRPRPSPSSSCSSSRSPSRSGSSHPRSARSRTSARPRSDSRTANPTSASRHADRRPFAASPRRSTRWRSGSTDHATTGGHCSPT